MSAPLLKDKKFNLCLNAFSKRYNSEVLDIILFGSTIRGKVKAEDIDILLLFRNKEDTDIAYDLRKPLEKHGYHVQITTKTYEKLFSESFQARSSILSEGYSLLRKKFIAEELGYTNKILFRYSLRGFTQSQRMQFQYALYGRDKKSGIVPELKLVKFAETTLLCPIEQSERLNAFFKQWNIPIEEYPILLPSRIL